MPQLQIRMPGGTVRQFKLGPKAVVIGREAGCDVRLEDTGVSRQHAMIRPVGEGYVLQDLGSSNGTWLNDIRVTSADLNHGDVITVNESRLIFDSADETVQRSSVLVVDGQAGGEHLTVSRSPSDLSLPEKRLKIIYDLSNRLTSLRDMGDLLEDAMDICFEMFQFQRGAIAVRKPDGRGVDWPVVRNLRGGQGELTVSRTILGKALDRGERSVVSDDDSQQEVRSVSMEHIGICSAMCVPLMVDQTVLGAIYGDRTSIGAVYSAEDVDFLYGIARQVTIGLLNSRLMEEQKRKVKLESEIKLAREIQTFMFPSELPDRPGLKVAAFNEPGEKVSGDYYDVIELSDGRLGLLIADVTGKGVAASLLMANLQGSVRATLADHDDPASALARWNNLLCRNTDGYNFITCLLGLLDPAGGRVLWATAGHCPPAVVSAGSKCRPVVTDAGLPLGIDAGATYSCTVEELTDKQVTLFMHTDGVTEAKDPDRAEFGHDKMLELLSDRDSNDPGKIIDDMMRAVRAFARGAPQSDDITMLAVQVG